MERLSLGPTEGDGDGGGNGGDDGVKAPRLPRWTRQEILVLIQGKRVAEGRVRRGRGGGGAGIGGGIGQVEPKWAAVSSYCRRHGVNRGPVQCRKRWSNLAGDFKRIKEWEARVADRAAESFWVMRNDLRRERRLPGFFDREVYDILDRGTGVPAPVLALALAPAAAAAAADEIEEAEEVIFDSGRSAAADDGLFSDFEQDDGGGTASPMKAAAATEAEELPTPLPLRVSSKLRGDLSCEQIPIFRGCQEQGTSNDHHTSPNPVPDPVSEEDGRKRKRPMAEAEEEDTPTLQSRLISVLERNGKLLTEQLEAQDRNSRLDRDQRKDQANGLLGVLSKLADALGKIADKL